MGHLKVVCVCVCLFEKDRVKGVSTIEWLQAVGPLPAIYHGLFLIYITFGHFGNKR